MIGGFDPNAISEIELTFVPVLVLPSRGAIPRGGLGKGLNAK